MVPRRRAKGAPKVTTLWKVWSVLAAFAAALVLEFGAGALPALADTITFDLTVANIAGAPPFATVSITAASSTALVTFTPDDSYLLSSPAALNVNGASPTLTLGACVLAAGGTCTETAGSPPKNVDGFGSYNILVNGPNNGFGPTGGMTSVSFTVAPTSGGTYLNAESVLLPNNKGLDAAVHVGIGCTGIGTIDQACANTGFASTPEPVSFALYGSGLLSLVGLVRLRRSLI